jgi:hypothetical protein
MNTNETDKKYKEIFDELKEDQLVEVKKIK